MVNVVTQCLYCSLYLTRQYGTLGLHRRKRGGHKSASPLIQRITNRSVVHCMLHDCSSNTWMLHDCSPSPWMFSFDYKVRFSGPGKKIWHGFDFKQEISQDWRLYWNVETGRGPVGECCQLRCFCQWTIYNIVVTLTLLVLIVKFPGVTSRPVESTIPDSLASQHRNVSPLPPPPTSSHPSPPSLLTSPLTVFGLYDASI